MTLRWRLPRVLLAASVVVIAAAAPRPSTAAAGAEEAPPPSVPPGVVLAPQGADEAGRRLAADELRASERALRKATASHKALTKRAPALQQQRTAAEARIAELTERDRAAADALVAARDRVRDMAIAGYVIGGDVPPVDYLLRSKTPADLVRRHQLVQRATESKADALDGYQDAKRTATTELEAALAAADALAATARQADSELRASQAAVDALRADVDHRRQLLDVITAAAPVGASDIPRLFLDAYRKAASTLAKRAPHCRVEWTAIAAIGKIESNHGRTQGARLALNGDVYPRIIGIPLDGTRKTRVIKDTDKGVLDLDTVYDRAVGPMQFIPSTWARIAQDANGDGVRDANNAYDGALATAAYLCRAVATGGLDTEEPLRRAFFSYNHSNAYVDAVYGWKKTFDSLAASV
ncbi:MAG TPA: lytic murein transglycosylase [Acidimicrobiales bacterium]